MADYVVACMTSPMFTYEDSPVYTLMEKAVARALTRRVGFNNGTAIPLVGGSMGNQLPILLSQIKKAPDTKRDGNSALPGCGAVFCGETGHYSTHKGTFYQGAGSDVTLTFLVTNMCIKTTCRNWTRQLSSDQERRLW